MGDPQISICSDPDLFGIFRVSPSLDTSLQCRDGPSRVLIRPEPQQFFLSVMSGAGQCQSGRKSRASYHLPVGTFIPNSSLSANSRQSRRKRTSTDGDQPGPKRHLSQLGPALIAPPTAPRDSVPSQYDRQLLTDDRVLANLLKLEDEHLRTPGNFDRIQTELQPHMRATVVTWMREVITPLDKSSVEVA